MWEEEGRSVSGEYLKIAAGTLSAHAEFSGKSRELYTRAAWHEGAIALKPSLKLSRRPRLADWGEYAAVVYEIMGWGNRRSSPTGTRS